MAKISLEIQTTFSGGEKKRTINVSYINSAVENDKLKEFAEKIVDLTTDSYEGATKITKESVI